MQTMVRRLMLLAALLYGFGSVARGQGVIPPPPPGPDQPGVSINVDLSQTVAPFRLDLPQWLNVSDGAVRISTTMPRQSVSLLALSW